MSSSQKSSKNACLLAGHILFLMLCGSARASLYSFGFNVSNGAIPDGDPNGRNVNPLSVVDTDPRTALLSSFNGLDPNGGWTLFFADLSSGEQSTLESWSLSINAVPEPTTYALIAFGGLVALRIMIRRFSRLQS